MGTVKKIWSLYSVKLALALGVSVFFGRASRIDMLGGTVLVCLTAFCLIRSFQDPVFLKKKTSVKTLIYILLAVFLLAGLIVMGGSTDPASQAIRARLSSSL